MTGRALLKNRSLRVLVTATMLINALTKTYCGLLMDRNLVFVGSLVDRIVML